MNNNNYNKSHFKTEKQLFYVKKLHLILQIVQPLK